MEVRFGTSQRPIVLARALELVATVRPLGETFMLRTADLCPSAVGVSYVPGPVSQKHKTSDMELYARNLPSGENER